MSNNPKPERHAYKGVNNVCDGDLSGPCGLPASAEVHQPAGEHKSSERVTQTFERIPEPVGGSRSQLRRLAAMRAEPAPEFDGPREVKSLWPPDLTLCPVCRVDLVREGLGTHGWDNGEQRILCPTLCSFPKPVSPSEAAQERDVLAVAIAIAAQKAGIYNGEVPLTGSQLIMLCDDLASAAIISQELPDAEKVRQDAFDEAIEKVRLHLLPSKPGEYEACLLVKNEIIAALEAAKEQQK